MINKINILAFLCFIFCLSSCLKDDSLVLNPKHVTSVVEFGSPSGLESAEDNDIRLYIQAYDISPLDSVIIPINYAGADAAPKDIVVKYEVDEAFLDSLYEREEFDYALLDPQIYTLPTSVTIKAGQKTANLIIPVKIDKIPFDEDYAIPLKMTDASGETISRNFNKIVVAVGAKNEYDGTYNYKTSAVTSLVPNADKTVQLHTAGPNRLKLVPGLLGTYSNAVYYNIDPATNQITVECPSLGVQTPQDPRSKYDPATRTLHVYWKQGNGGRTFEETIRYTGPR